MPFSIRFGSEDWKVANLLKLEPLIIGAFATAHIVSSLRYFWNDLKKRREQKAEQKGIASSLYGRVVSGECHYGWKMIVPAEMIAAQQSHVASWTTSRVRFASVGNNNANWLDHVLSSVVGSPSPDGHRVYTLRMRSLVCPEVNGTMLRISCSLEDWSVYHTLYLDDSTNGILFRRPADTARYRLVICSAYRRGHLNIRKYDLHSPIKNGGVVLVYFGGTKSRLFVLFSRYTWNDFEDDEQNAQDHDAESKVLEYNLASYDFRVADEPDNKIHYPLGCEGISIPIRNRYEFQKYYPVAGEEMVAVLHNGANSTNYSPPLCVTYKANRGWTVDGVGVWAQRLKSERDSTDVSMWKALKVMSSFRRLDPPKSRCWTRRQLPLVGKCEQGVCHGDGFFAATRDGLFRRWINPPSLKYLAAEALFRSNPTLQRMSRLELKREVGIDVFEGIPEEKEGEDEVPTIYL